MEKNQNKQNTGTRQKGITCRTYIDQRHTHCLHPLVVFPAFHSSIFFVYHNIYMFYKKNQQARRRGMQIAIHDQRAHNPYPPQVHQWCLSVCFSLLLSLPLPTRVVKLDVQKKANPGFQVTLYWLLLKSSHWALSFQLLTF